MAYQVLARKWRPQRFSDVVGQQHVTTTLENAIRTGRLAHGFLFCGPRGVGKTTTARILAKCLNCETAVDGPVAEPCNECASCVETAEGRNLDVLEIDGASNRGIDEIRDLRENVRYAPSGGRAKVYIIDEVHMLTKEAFNALLKTLEEPPPGVYFVFATTEVHKVPATIRSRCQRYDFHRIAPEAIQDTLIKLAKNEKFKVEPEAIQELARHAEGGLRDAQSLLDQAAAVGEGKVTLEGVRSLLGEAEDEALLAISEAVLGRDTGQAFVRLQELLERGLDPGRVATALTRTFRDLLVARTAAGQAASLGVRVDLVPEYERLAQLTSVDKLTALLTLAGRAVADLRRSARPRLTLEVALARFCRLEDPGDMAALVARLEGIAAGAPAPPAGSAPAPASPTGGTAAAPPRPAAPPAPFRAAAEPRATARERSAPREEEDVPPPSEEPPPAAYEADAPGPRHASSRHGGPSHGGPNHPGPRHAASADAPSGPEFDAGPPAVPAAARISVADPDLARLWGDLVARVEGRKKLLGQFLQHGAPTAWDGSTLTAVFESSYYEGQVTKPASLSMILEELKAATETPSVTFRARTGKLPIGARAAEEEDEPAAKPTNPRDLLEAHPGLRRAIHDLGGRVLPSDG